MSGNRSRVHALSLILILALAPIQACGARHPGTPVRLFRPNRPDSTILPAYGQELR
jgi:hypothetical protein